MPAVELAGSGFEAGERLFGLDRLVSILAVQGRDPVFVLEDTEAAIGGADTETVEAFFAGPVRAFINEVEASTLVAVQDHLARSSSTFAELQPMMRLVEIPHLDDAHSHRGVRAIVGHRLDAHEIGVDTDSILGADALDPLIAFYDESGRSLRHMLAALQSAVEHAADMGSEAVRAAHIRAAAQDWRARMNDAQ